MIYVGQKLRKGPLDGSGLWSHMTAISLKVYLILSVVMTLMLSESIKDIFETVFYVHIMALMDETRELQTLYIVPDIAGKDFFIHLLII